MALKELLMNTYKTLNELLTQEKRLIKLAEINEKILL